MSEANILPAVFTPMHVDGSINYHMIKSLYQRVVDSGFNGIFLNGTTGECMSLSVNERMKLLERWVDCKRSEGNENFKVFVHVGSANLFEAAEMAEHAKNCRADAIAMVSSFYYRPKKLSELIDQCRFVASAAPDVPYYYYNIPSMTGVNFPLADFIPEAIKAIPTFSGLKNSFNDLVDYQECLHRYSRELELYWGSDEVFMMVYAAGNRNYVGSTYNFMGHAYLRMQKAFRDHKHDALIKLQRDATEIYAVLKEYPALAGGKEVMRMVGLDCGPPRMPLKSLGKGEVATLHEKLQNTALFEFAMTEKVLKQ